MFKKIVFTGLALGVITSSLLATDSKGTNLLYGSFGSKKYSDIGYYKNHKNSNLSTLLEYKNIDNLKLYKGSLNEVILIPFKNDIERGIELGVGILHSKNKRDNTTKPFLNLMTTYNLDMLNTAINFNGYFADINNLGATVDVHPLSWNFYSDLKNMKIGNISTGFSFDKIQNENKSLIYLRLNYLF